MSLPLVYGTAQWILKPDNVCSCTAPVEDKDAGELRSVDGSIFRECKNCTKVIIIQMPK